MCGTRARSRGNSQPPSLGGGIHRLQQHLGKGTIQSTCHSPKHSHFGGGQQPCSPPPPFYLLLLLLAISCALLTACGARLQALMQLRYVLFLFPLVLPNKHASPTAVKSKGKGNVKGPQASVLTPRNARSKSAAGTSAPASALTPPTTAANTVVFPVRCRRAQLMQYLSDMAWIGFDITDDIKQGRFSCLCAFVREASGGGGGGCGGRYFAITHTHTRPHRFLVPVCPQPCSGALS